MEHALLAGALITELGLQLRGGPRRVATSDLRVRILATGKATYPDITVLCGAPQLDPNDPKGHTVLSPTVLVEITSDSTEDDDRGDKFDVHYAQIPTLAEYVLVAHRERAIEVRRRGPDGAWVRVVAGPSEQVELVSVDAVLDVDALYDAALGPGAPRAITA